jgi:hypothetical protein
MSDLSLRATIIGGDRLEDDFQVIRDGRRIGRIRRAPERVGHNPGWDWTIGVPLPVPAWGHGSAGSLEDAKAAFRQAWEKFYAGLRPEDIAHWHHHQDAAAERFWR